MANVKKTEYKLFPTQYKFLFGYDKSAIGNNGDYVDISLYQGGFGSGKTFCGSLRGLLFAFTWGGCTGLVGAATQDLLDNTTKAKYEWHLANIGMKEGVHWWWSDRKTKMTFLNGSTIRFKTVSNWENFRSTEFTWIELEEASLIDEKTFKELIARLREAKRNEWKDYFRSIFLHTNPQGSRGWMYRFFHNPKTKLEGYRAVIAATKENTFLSKSYIKTLQSLYSADEAQELLEGIDLDNDNTVAFPNFTQANIVEDLKYNPEASLILTCDFNYNPMCWYIVQEYNNNWYILKELIDNNITTKEMCKAIQPILDKYPTKSIVIMGDAHGKDKKTNGSDYSIMTQHFMNAGYNVMLKVQKSNPFIKDRLAILRRYIKNANGERHLFVDESCKRLLYNFDECKNQLANGGLKLPTDTEIQQDDNKRYLIHPIDAVSYPMYYLDRLRATTGDDSQAL